MTTVNGWDCIGGNVGLIPTSLGPYGGGYLTGDPPVPWTPAQRAKFPQAVMYDQWPKTTTVGNECDAFDYETGTVKLADLVPDLKAARENFNAGVRAGQRWPAVYMSESRVTEVVNDLIKGGISACPLIVADYNLSQGEAAEKINTTSGPFPIVGVQYSNKGGGGAWDLAVYNLEWLNRRSKVVTPPPVNQNVTVPNVIGESAGSAHNALAGAGLVPTAPQGQKATDIVIGTSPVSGTSVPHGSPILILAVSDLSITINGHSFDIKL